jgi:hypothetical protein
MWDKQLGILRQIEGKGPSTQSRPTRDGHKRLPGQILWTSATAPQISYSNVSWQLKQSGHSIPQTTVIARWWPTPCSSCAHLIQSVGFRSFAQTLKQFECSQLAYSASTAKLDLSFFLKNWGDWVSRDGALNIDEQSRQFIAYKEGAALPED